MNSERLLTVMHQSVQSPTPPPHPGKGGDLSLRGCKRRTQGAKILENPLQTPYYFPSVYSGARASC